MYVGMYVCVLVCVLINVNPYLGIYIVTLRTGCSSHHILTGRVSGIRPVNNSFLPTLAWASLSPAAEPVPPDFMPRATTISVAKPDHIKF